MDALSSLPQDVAFKVTFRGYDLGDVDAYVDRVAKTAAQLQGRIAELQQQAEVAAAASSESETTIVRTLILAQRTADAVVAEAKEAAALLSSEAKDQASRQLAEAEIDRRQILTDAGTAAATKSVEERNRLADDVRELEQYRSFLSDDVEILERHLADQRRALATSLAALTELIEEPGAFRASAAPATSGAEMDITGFEEPVVDDSVADEFTFNPTPIPEPVAAHAETAMTEPVETDVLEPVAAHAETAMTEPVETDVLEPVAAIGDEAPLSVVPVADFAAEPPLLVTAEAVAEDTPTAEHQMLPDLGPENDALVFRAPELATRADPFLEQLRDAVASEEPADFGDDALAAFFDQNDADSSRSWFNRRR